MYKHTTALSEDLFKEGFRRILSNDYSQVVIDRLANETYRDHPVLRFACMDCRCMPLPDAAFDFVLDKGTLDAVLCSGDVRDENAARMLDEVFRILVRSAPVKECVQYILHASLRHHH